ncbi:MAG: tetraacyldisaccharide 4'-kinase [Lewinellaceae bacterium]|nr:tetraacyldisaccharide 4'-kinase [Lewinellaceae bacterium]
MHNFSGFRKMLLQLLLAPLSLLYGFGVSLFTLGYTLGLVKSSKFNIPIISIGNLTIGGTGKTPHIEYLIMLLKDYIDIGVLSRGYKRETQGFRFVQTTDNALTVGDEPLQFKRKYRDIVVAVGESRAYAIPQILQNFPHIQTILLDDAFQHLAVKPGLNILLTSYELLFTRDYLLPSGRLREWRSGYRRADCIIVSKCPSVLTDNEAQDIIKEINPYAHQKVFFTYYEYAHPYSFFEPNHRLELDESLDIILLSAIADTSYLTSYLSKISGSIHEIEYADHHVFDDRDIERITKVYKNIPNEKKIVLTTEKDAMRLDLKRKALLDANIAIFVLPVRVRFHFFGQTFFDEYIKQYLLSFEL